MQEKRRKAIFHEEEKVDAFRDMAKHYHRTPQEMIDFLLEKFNKNKEIYEKIS